MPDAGVTERNEETVSVGNLECNWPTWLFAPRKDGRKILRLLGIFGQQVNHFVPLRQQDLRSIKSWV